ncbi:adenine-specific DNA methylase [Gloeomargarita lithophora Alchichica-D10]|uniref:Site-specific DNA-methyltransferase (adenine-specific) n=1 Tax=Gloeomargarita lithophora Alchichica-D10 TaxID=1188229 RepID=A0A1J0AAU1_9CYAN|nr:Dam family site-specific DNA-(adenine-N6)-methyltransferase [Gloeomargarita lithophora]APB33047.1 adenine-specific DNA methylase [Gloeomargarita lithophora Alchichica-D10]
MIVPLVPPIKCQGIKTKLVQKIADLFYDLPNGRWIEPFCGSCVVPLNVQPKRALLCDSNVHIIQFYKDVQLQLLTPENVKDYLRQHGDLLRTKGEDYFYEVRNRFNTLPNSFDFLFLNRSCFNGVMRFNRSGRFNVPFCRKPDRFSSAYITKIINQLGTIARVMLASDWEFRVADFRWTIAQAKSDDFVYADPPYAGRHVDFFNSWSEQDEMELSGLLSHLPCRFILSTWHSNEFRINQEVKKNWSSESYCIFTHEHYYHVGATENLRHPMIEALITNFSHRPDERPKAHQPSLWVEQTQTIHAPV